MIIVWPNSDGTITLSQRTASGNVEPDGGFELDTGNNCDLTRAEAKRIVQSCRILLAVPRSSRRLRSPTLPQPA